MCGIALNNESAPRRELAQTGARADACVASLLVTVVSRGATRECAAYQIYGGSDEQPRDGATSQDPRVAPGQSAVRSLSHAHLSKLLRQVLRVL